MSNAFQTTAFQQTVGFVAFQEFTGVVTGGLSIASEKEIEVWQYKPYPDTLFRHMAAVLLGQKGGQAYASSLKKR